MSSARSSATPLPAHSPTRWIAMGGRARRGQARRARSRGRRRTPRAGSRGGLQEHRAPHGRQDGPVLFSRQLRPDPAGGHSAASLITGYDAARRSHLIDALAEDVGADLAQPRSPAAPPPRRRGRESGPARSPVSPAGRHGLHRAALVLVPGVQARQAPHFRSCRERQGWLSSQRWRSPDSRYGPGSTGLCLRARGGRRGAGCLPRR
jgi:hypothetical protein